ncbi:hypothetical protein D9615_007160 [Tricholomella constricta]|uniref:PCI domain-containing protein n=1 Tax=Tricholomella constricta TaxID=117010 RepID=A0A8H5M2S7_9AGAR|nr:hypothetical protein D9615_007160 [Tricholomella constricta]
MSPAAMAVDASKPPKLDLDKFVATALSATPPDLHSYFENFRHLHTRKLWHQLTQKLFQFLDDPQSKPYRVDVFEQFVRDFEGKINQLRLVEMGAKVSKEIDNPQTHLSFLTSLLSRIDSAKSQEAHVLLLATIAHAKLLYGDLEGTKTDMDAAWKVLDTLEGVENGVNAAYYGVAADYYKARAEYAPYYRNSLLYLACVDTEKDMTSEERLVRAHDLGISAFLGDTIYNFGELLMHPILDALVGTPHEWIKKLLFTFNEGNIGKFEALSPLFPKEPILQENYAFLRQKICLMALIESVFKRNADNRTMTFRTIAEETRLPIDEVEHLVMKALSLKLIRGSLDQVEQKAHITWVQPRVLSREQIGTLAQRLDDWVNKLNAVEQRIAPEMGDTMCSSFVLDNVEEFSKLKRDGDYGVVAGSDEDIMSTTASTSIQLLLMSVPSLPQELIEYVIDYLKYDVDALLACSLVCKAWVASAQRYLLSDILIGDFDSEETLVPALAAYARRLMIGNGGTISKENLQHFSLITSLYIYDSAPKAETRLGLPSMFPFVTYLELMDVFFTTFDDMAQLFCSISQLQVLTLSCNWLNDCEPPSDVCPPSSLHTLNIRSTGLNVILRWFIHLHTIPPLSTLRLFVVFNQELPAVGATLQALSNSLRCVELQSIENSHEGEAYSQHLVKRILMNS